tara:strand:+ start:1784 stop:2371 length:588 start_codon:yes stop_codon:yes gene_type:complete
MAKKKTTAKSSKKQESKIEEPKALTEQDRIDHINKINELKGSKAMKLPDDVVVNIPVSGFFYKTFEGLFYHLMEPLNASQILQTMEMIKNNFKDIDEKKITNTQRALWAVLTLMSEIHWQAAAQGKLVETDDTHASMVEQILHGAEGAPEALAEGLQKHKTAGEEKTSEKSDAIKQALEDKIQELKNKGMLGDIT